MSIRPLPLLLALLAAGAAFAQSPVRPAGRIADSRRPVFRWSAVPNAKSYTLELTQDGVRLPPIPVPGGSNTWQSATNLPVGAYRWRVKKGPAGSANPWSPRLDFSLLPDLPVPEAPAGRSTNHPTVPALAWRCDDPAATRFTLRLFRGTRALGSLTVNPAAPGPAFAADWTNALPAGSYSWSVRAVRPLPGFNVAGDWSDPLPFQYGVPAQPVFTNPAPDTVFPPTTDSVAIGWSPTDGADAYTLKILRNDRIVGTFSNLTAEAGALNENFNPSYYTLLVRGENGDGIGPWSDPLTFIIRRNMSPDGTTTNRTPPTFRWTRSDPASGYELRILQYDAAKDKYVPRRTVWIPQPAAGNPKWTPPFRIPNGRYRWTVTDFNGDRRGYTQSALFRIRNTPYDTWNDPALIVGRWKVVSPWRWVEMTFQADGIIRTVQADGTAYTRARWSADDTTLTLVSDVTEKCPYEVTATTLSFLLPSGNLKQLVRIQ